MIDITHKIKTLRIATAVATVQVSSQATVEAVLQKKVPKGDVLEMAKTAGLFAVKKTAEMIPDCHPIPIESTKVSYEIEGLQIRIFIEVASIYRTGVEVEAMHGASVIALTIYDMLKPIDKNIEIQSIRLASKKGGKTDFTGKRPYTAAVIVCSDTISQGKKEDKAGKAVMDKLTAHQVEVTEYKIIPDEKDDIQKTVMEAVDKKTDLIIISGGTGLSPRDVTPEAVQPLLEREIPGIMEAARSYGQERTPYAMLSRGIAGTIKNSVVLTIPGSTNGAKETIEAVFPYLLHLFPVLNSARHD